MLKSSHLFRTIETGRPRSGNHQKFPQRVFLRTNDIRIFDNERIARVDKKKERERENKV